MSEGKKHEKTESSFEKKVERFVSELIGADDYSTPTTVRDNKVTKGVATYKNQGDGKGAAQNVANEIRKRKKMLDEI